MQVQDLDTPWRIGRWTLDPRSGALTRDDGPQVHLEPRLTRVLVELASRPDTVISAEALLATVWSDVVVTADSVYQAMAQLRRSLGEDAGYIETVPRKGYRLTAEVRRLERPAPPASARPRRWLAASALTVALGASVVVTAALAGPEPGRRVLWVDDHPENNRREREALAALGVAHRTARSTAEALAIVAREPYSLVVSDMSRPESKLAGYQLLDELRQRGVTTPLIIYTGACLPEHRAEARRRGATACVDRVSELLAAATAVLEDARALR